MMILIGENFWFVSTHNLPWSFPKIFSQYFLCFKVNLSWYSFKKVINLKVGISLNEDDGESSKGEKF